MMKYFWIFFISLLIISHSVSLEKEARFQFQLDAGMGTYTGDFRTHLIDAGAWLNSPVLEGSFIIFPGNHVGMGLAMGSMTVIHPRSTPIEGIIRYQELIVEFPFQRGKYWISPFIGTGFQDPGMSLEWYGSAVGDLGIRAGKCILDNLSLTFTAGYRFSYLRSLLIASEYNFISEWDNLSSLRLNLGLRYYMNKGTAL